MSDLSKLREGLEHCLRNHCLGCPYAEDCFSREGDLSERLHKDMLELVDWLEAAHKPNGRTDGAVVVEAFEHCLREPKCQDCPWAPCEEFEHEMKVIPADLGYAVLSLLKAKGGFAT